tara:strand:+ start:476 stop:646 length:171 start_codon:yes stop_codon:yes gene_type:complete
MNIEQHEFSDMYMPKVLSANEIAVVLSVEELPWVSLNKEDTIALAKHFKLTSADIE